MRITDKLNHLFTKAKHNNGFVPMHKLEQITLNYTLIREIAYKKGFRTTYKPNSQKITGYGDYRHSENWS